MRKNHEKKKSVSVVKEDVSGKKKFEFQHEKAALFYYDYLAGFFVNSAMALNSDHCVWIFEPINSGKNDIVFTSELLRYVADKLDKLNSAPNYSFYKKMKRVIEKKENEQFYEDLAMSNTSDKMRALNAQ